MDIKKIKPSLNPRNKLNSRLAHKSGVQIIIEYIEKGEPSRTEDACKYWSNDEGGASDLEDANYRSVHTRIRIAQHGLIF